MTFKYLSMSQLNCLSSLLSICFHQIVWWPLATLNTGLHQPPWVQERPRRNVFGMALRREQLAPLTAGGTIPVLAGLAVT
jgi:hypothetical protein